MNSITSYDNIATHYFLDDWEIRQGLQNMLFFRGRVFTADGKVLLEEACYTKRIKDIDAKGRIVSCMNELIELGRPARIFAESIQDLVMISPNMSSDVFAKLSEITCTQRYRLYPGIILLWDYTSDLASKEIVCLLEDEKNIILAKIEQNLLSRIRQEQLAGQFCCYNGKWYFNDAVIYTETEFELQKPEVLEVLEVLEVPQVTDCPPTNNINDKIHTNDDDDNDGDQVDKYMAVPPEFVITSEKKIVDSSASCGCSDSSTNDELDRNVDPADAINQDVANVDSADAINENVANADVETATATEVKKKSSYLFGWLGY